MLSAKFWVVYVFVNMNPGFWLNYNIIWYIILNVLYECYDGYITHYSINHDPKGKTVENTYK